MTTLDDVYTFVPGGQASWHASTASFASLVLDVAAWRAVQAGPNFNAPISWSANRDFAPLTDLLAEAECAPGLWQSDTPAFIAEQQENALAFRDSQFNVIFGQGD